MYCNSFCVSNTSNYNIISRGHRNIYNYLLLITTTVLLFTNTYCTYLTPDAQFVYNFCLNVEKIMYQELQLLV